MSWKAIAYMPPGYDPGKRYPLVIQTHGYSEKTFEPDGTSTTVMAAQPLANSGIVVVQLGGPDGPAPRSILQATQWMKGIEGLIDTLDAQGLVNRQRVGMTGWSATGWLVEYFLTHSEYPIRAAIAADNVEYGYWEYLLYATRTGFVSHYDEVYGDSPWKKPDTWWKDSPAFELQRVQTPLRIEVDSDPPIGHWQIYAGLKLLHKPVELVIIPDDYHSLVRPSHRMTSQGGAVDWFRFWLKDEEDTDPSKSQQYARWHTMRDQKAREGAR
jgi:dipeptidyl aminopeptidase/acylaminoacyl peptidase